MNETATSSDLQNSDIGLLRTLQGVQKVASLNVLWGWNLQSLGLPF